MTEQRFKGQTAIVTGSGSKIGLGFQYALLLAKEGAKVVLHGRNEEQIKESVNHFHQLGYTDVVGKVADACDRQAVRHMVGEVIDQWGKVDILINNAGAVAGDIWPYSSEQDYTQLDYVIKTNIYGTLHFMEALWPHMEKEAYGRIVNVASNSLFGCNPTVAYPSTKAFLLTVTRTAAFTGRELGILTNAIAPAASSQLTLKLPESPFLEHLVRDFPPEKAAPAVLALCQKDCSANGGFFSVGGGQINRFTFANTPSFPAEDVTQAAQSIKKLMETSKFDPVDSSFDDLKRYGFTEEEYAYYGFR